MVRMTGWPPTFPLPSKVRSCVLSVKLGQCLCVCAQVIYSCIHVWLYITNSLSQPVWVCCVWADRGWTMGMQLIHERLAAS